MKDTAVEFLRICQSVDDMAGDALVRMVDRGEQIPPELVAAMFNKLNKVSAAMLELDARLQNIEGDGK